MLKKLMNKAQEALKVVTSEEFRFVAKEMVKSVPANARLVMRGQTYHIFHSFTHVGYVEDVEIIESNSLVEQVTELPETVPMAVALENRIAVNESFRKKLSHNHQWAIIYHELAHIKLNHLEWVAANGEDYHLHLTLGYGRGLELEFEADEYAASRGYDIHGALITALDHAGGIRTPGLARRLWRLQNAN